MQFGREPLPQSPSALTAGGEPGWVCTESPGHFQLGSGSRRAAATGTGPQGRWDDDGGAALRESEDPQRLLAAAKGA